MSKIVFEHFPRAKPLPGARCQRPHILRSRTLSVPPNENLPNPPEKTQFSAHFLPLFRFVPSVQENPGHRSRVKNAVARRAPRLTIANWQK
jgi:hypothetical protein